MKHFYNSESVSWPFTPLLRKSRKSSELLKEEFLDELALPANLGNFCVFNLLNGIVVKIGTIGELFSMEGNLLNRAVLLKV